MNIIYIEFAFDNEQIINLLKKRGSQLTNSLNKSMIQKLKC